MLFEAQADRPHGWHEICFFSFWHQYWVTLTFKWPWPLNHVLEEYHHIQWNVRQNVPFIHLNLRSWPKDLDTKTWPRYDRNVSKIVGLRLIFRSHWLLLFGISCFLPYVFQCGSSPALLLVSSDPKGHISCVTPAFHNVYMAWQPSISEPHTCSHRNVSAYLKQSS